MRLAAATNDLPLPPVPALKTTGSRFRDPRTASLENPSGHRRRFMRKPNGRLGPLLFVAACAALLVGCKEEFSDQPFGVLDLASVYDGGTLNNPAAGVPEQINPRIGFL